MVTRVLIVGAGAIGGALAAKLAASSENEVSLAVRRPTPPLRLVTSEGESLPSIAIVRSPEELLAQDWVVVATKAYDTAGVGRWLTAAACAEAAIAVAQNGVEQAERVGEFVESERVIPLIVTIGAERREPGVIVETLSGRVRAPASSLGRRFAEIASSTPLDVELVDDFAAALWTKLCWNLAGNSLTTVLDVPVRHLGHSPPLRELIGLLVEECRAVAASEGAAVPASVLEEILRTFADYPDTVRSSMWQDRAAGRSFEYDAIAGAVVRAAARNGIDAPYSRTVLKLLESLSPRSGADVPSARSAGPV